MQKITVLLLFFFIIQFMYGGNDCRQIKKIKIYSSSYSSTSEFAYSPAKFLSTTRYKSITIRESKKFCLLHEYLQDSNKFIKRIYFNTRIVCLIYYNDKLDPDTLAFGFCRMYYNGQVYELDLNIFDLIIPYLPKTHQKIIKKEWIPVKDKICQEDNEYEESEKN